MHGLSVPFMISSYKLRVQMKLAGSKSFTIISNDWVHLRNFQIFLNYT